MRPSSYVVTGLGLGLGLFVALPARADTVTLKNGREVHGRLVEEREDVIRIRTGGGVIEIRKAEVATFSENENWGDYGREVPTETPKPDAGDKPGETDKLGDKPGDKPGGKPGGTMKPGEIPTKENWKWPAGLSKDKIAELTPIRDRLLEEREKLGPPAEERLAKLKLHPEEADKLRELMERLDYRQQQGSANMIRRRAKERIVDELGLKAVEALVGEARKEDHYWGARMAAETLESLCKDDEARWVMYHFDAPAAVMTLLKHQGDRANSAPMRSQGNKTLMTLTAHDVKWVDGTESMRSGEETAGMERWASWWGRELQRWKDDEKKKEERRGAIVEALGKLLKGENPEG